VLAQLWARCLRCLREGRRVVDGVNPQLIETSALEAGHLKTNGCDWLDERTLAGEVLANLNQARRGLLATDDSSFECGDGV
jgi:hypothetical protein